MSVEARSTGNHRIDAFRHIHSRKHVAAGVRNALYARDGNDRLSRDAGISAGKFESGRGIFDVETGFFFLRLLLIFQI